MQWHHITLDGTKENTRSSRPLRTPSIQALDQHASLIRSFTFKGSLPSEILPFLVNSLQSNQVGSLVSLSFIKAAIPQGLLSYWDFVLQLVALSSSTLQEFCIQEFVNESLLRELVNKSLLRELFVGRLRQNDMNRRNQWGALRHLALSLYCIADLETWIVMLEVFQQLESLELGFLRLDITVSRQLEPIYNIDRKQPEATTTLGQQHQHQKLTQGQARFPHLKWLKLTQIDGISSKTCLNHLVAQSPSLRGLCWTISKGRGFSAREFYDFLKAGTWPRLEALEIYGHPIQIPDHILAAILNVESTRAGKQVSFRKLCVPRSTFGSMAMAALLSPTRGHTKTLQELDLSKCYQVSSKMAQDILAACPRLEVFSANNIDPMDAARDQPLVCT
ncbi:hypothetical protein BGX34_004011 [Mortierella sp. NVP85]|nr:hypothetical protein BGX34_004011 [Mortierella sp. NVP85]